jgi:hypothetical protein
MPLRVKRIAQFYFHRLYFPASEREMKNESESGQAVAYLQVVEPET